MSFLTSLARAVALALLPLAALAQTGGVRIGTAGAPDPSAALDVSSTTKGLLLPRLSLAQRDALTANAATPPVPGLVIYQTDNTPGLYAYDGTAWVRLGADNLGNHTATTNLGLNGNWLSNARTNANGIRIDNGGNVGIGVAAPTAVLDVEGGILARANGLISNQGAHLQWNRTGGAGETWLLNQQGGGPGGIRFGASDAVSSGSNTLTEWARFDGSGYLGLGTTSPSQLLDVNGGILARAHSPISNQGAYLQWNRSGGDGETWLLNQQGGGGANAGIRFGGATTGNGVTEWGRFLNNGYFGLGTGAPAAALDVNGALVLEETASSSLTGADPSFVVPANVSSVRLVPGTTAPTGTVTLTSTNPVVGQRLSVYNGTPIGATLGGTPIAAGQAGFFVYSNGNWRGVGTPAGTGTGDNLGNHTANQSLNLNGNKLVGGTTARAVRGGLGIDGNGLLTLGAARPASDSITTFGARLTNMDQDVVLTSKSFYVPPPPFEPRVYKPLPVTGVGDRVMWLSYYRAFRAGGVSGGGTIGSSPQPTSVQWDNPNIGQYSTAFGLDNLARDDYSTAFGNNNVVRAGEGTLVTGYGNNAVQTFYGLMTGYQNTMRGRNGLVGGYQSKVQTSLTLPTPSLAFGYRAQARTSQSGCVALGYYARTGGYQGSFVLADYSPVGTDYANDSLVSTAFNQFSARFAGGYRLFTTTATNDQNNGIVQTPVGVQLMAGGNAWQTLSDSTLKERRMLADGNAFLARIGQMRLGSWNYRGQSPDTMRHYGPMAQDFFAAFGHDGVGRIGEPRSINQADFDGVNLIAIQALYRRVLALEAANARLGQQVQQLQAVAPVPAAATLEPAPRRAAEVAELRRQNAALRARAAAAEARSTQATATLEAFEARLQKLEAATGSSGQAQR